MVKDSWAEGGAYEAYVGRWSRVVARAFLDWLDLPGGLRWLDAGCGTGALTAAILATASPRLVLGIDPSVGFLAAARSQITDARATFRPGDARVLPSGGDFDVIVSGLALNFVPEPAEAVRECARVLPPGGVAAAYVWDYAEGMAMIREFWSAAVTLDMSAAALDESWRFPVCHPDALHELWTGAGFGEVAVQAIDVPTTFRNVDDFWTPFLGGQGPAPSYVVALPEERRVALRELLRTRLPVQQDGSIPLTARAWAVRGTAQPD